MDPLFSLASTSPQILKSSSSSILSVSATTSPLGCRKRGSTDDLQQTNVKTQRVASVIAESPPEDSLLSIVNSPVIFETDPTPLKSTILEHQHIICKFLENAVQFGFSYEIPDHLGFRQTHMVQIETLSVQIDLFLQTLKSFFRKSVPKGSLSCQDERKRPEDPLFGNL